MTFLLIPPTKRIWRLILTLGLKTRKIWHQCGDGWESRNGLVWLFSTRQTLDYVTICCDVTLKPLTQFPAPQRVKKLSIIGDIGSLKFWLCHCIRMFWCIFRIFTNIHKINIMWIENDGCFAMFILTVQPHIWFFGILLAPCDENTTCKTEIFAISFY